MTRAREDMRIIRSWADRLAGEELGVYPAAVQAATWIYWRKSK